MIWARTCAGSANRARRKFPPQRFYDDTGLGVDQPPGEPRASASGVGLVRERDARKCEGVALADLPRSLTLGVRRVVANRTSPPARLRMNPWANRITRIASASSAAASAAWPPRARSPP